MNRSTVGVGEIFPGVHDPGAKRFFEGTHRVKCPEETLKKLLSVAGDMGITRVANVTGLDTIGIPVVMVVRPKSRSLSVNQGKGCSLAAAKVSGLMEATESYHAERVAGPLLWESWDVMRTRHDMIDVGGLVRENAEELDPDRPILWITGYDLQQQRWVQVPHEAVNTDFTLRTRDIGGGFKRSSNGLAAGNCLLEAISHGICEVVERDAYARWVESGRFTDAADRIDVHAISDRNLLQMLERCRQANMCVALWDMLSPCNIASVYCELIGPLGDIARPAFSACGSGSHAVREVACLRALTEAVQSRATVISGSREDLTRPLYAKALGAEGLEQRARELDDQPPGRRFEDLPSSSFQCLAEENRWYLDRLRESGVDSVVVVDLSREEIGVPVVRVVVPHARLREE